MRWVPLLLLLLLLPAEGLSHEVRPAYLKIEETGESQFNVQWKAPLVAGKLLAVEPRFPAYCTELPGRRLSREALAVVAVWRLSCDEPGLVGSEVQLAGLAHTFVDVFVEIVTLDGARTSLLLMSDRPAFIYGGQAGAESRGGLAWFRLGVEHLLMGWDHILFVVGLVLLLRKPGDLVKVITSFTVAHSLTLGLSALGGITLNQSAVEAVIALSILVLAVELAKPQLHGQTLIFRYPWSITFIFGLLHGFGFAGALRDIGLPEDSAIMALLLFNLGVEVGQLIIVALILMVLAAWRIVRLPQSLLENYQLQVLPAQCMGVLAGYWFVERTLGLVV